MSQNKIRMEDENGNVFYPHTAADVTFTSTGASIEQVHLNHVAEKNPHGTTKADVGLGSVQNYGLATQAEAEAGTSTSKYMTPQRTKQAIDKNIVTISQSIQNVGTRLTQHLDGDVANVKDFGAEGDGITNDFEAIRAAINTGREVYLPQGAYFIGNNVLSGIKSLSGAGKDLTKIIFEDVDPAININANHFKLADFSIFNSGQGTAINVNVGNYGLIDNVFIQDVTNGIIVANTQALRINNVDMWGFENYGLFLSGSNNDIFISNLFINGQGNGTIPTGTGVRMLNKSEAITFDSIEVILCVYALSTDATENAFNSRPAYCVFSNCFFDSSTEGVLLDKIVNFRFNQCWFSNRPSSGCILNTVDDVTFNSCSFINNAQHGCVVQNGAKRVKFLGCSFISNSTLNPNTYHGLTFASDTTDFIVKNCTATNSFGMTGIQHGGISVDAGTSNRYVISDNLVSGNGGNGVSDNGTGTDKNVENNF